LKNAQAVVVGRFARLVPGHMIVSLKNLEGSKVSGTLELSGDGIRSMAPVGFEIPGNGETTCKVPVRVEDMAVPYKDASSLASYEGTWDDWRTVYAKINLGDKLGSASLPIERLIGGKTTSLGKVERENLKGSSFIVTRDGQNLNVRFDVKDSTPSGEPNGRKPWAQDYVKICFDILPDHLSFKDQGGYTSYVGSVLVAPYAHEGERLVKNEKLDFSGAKERTVINPDGYSIDISIPLAALNLQSPQKGGCIGFEVEVGEACGGQKTSKWLRWSSHGDAWKNRLAFGYLQF
jgi:hypothetical protein